MSHFVAIVANCRHTIRRQFVSQSHTRIIVRKSTVILINSYSKSTKQNKMQTKLNAKQTVLFSCIIGKIPIRNPFKWQ